MPNYRDWRDRSRVFESFAGYAGGGHTVTGRGPAYDADSYLVIGDLFGTLGITAALGRVFTTEEVPDHSGAAPLAVVGHSFWVNRLGADPGVIGQALVLDDRPYTIIGVLPRAVGFPSPDAQVYLPMATDPDLPWDDRDSGFGTRIIARLAPNVPSTTARLDLERAGQEVRELAGKAVSVPELRSLETFLVGRVEKQLWILLGAVAFVLLIAVANVGNLLLARGEDRQKELAVRTALGADRGSLVRLLLVEALLIAIAGGVLGVGLAYLAVGALIPLLPTDVPAVLLSRITIDGRMLAFGGLTALIAGLVFGLVPAWRSVRASIAATVKSGGRTATSGGGRLRAALVVAEIALALVLLVSAGLMIRSLERLRRVDKGFDSANILTAAVPSRAQTRGDWHSFYSKLRDRAAGLPGVTQAALALLLPLSERSWELRVWPQGVPPDPATGQSVLYNIVSPEYFPVLRVPILSGRGFDRTDRAGSTLVAMIDETMAERFWPGGDPIGQQITIGEQDSSGATVYRTVIGVTRNIRHYQLTQASRIQVYVPFDQTYRRWGMGIRLLLATTGTPATVVEPLRTLVTQLDPDIPVNEARPLDQLVSGAMSQNRAMTRVLTVFGTTALALAALGIFGVMSYLVARQTREIGIRIALGAAAADVTRWIGGRALRLTAMGTAIGVIGAIGLTRLLEKALFEVNPLDPVAFGWAAVGLGVVAMVAALLPARRATRVDPVTVLNDGDQ
jgi:predicted permease